MDSPGSYGVDTGGWVDLSQLSQLSLEAAEELLPSNNNYHFNSNKSPQMRTYVASGESGKTQCYLQVEVRSDHMWGGMRSTPCDPLRAAK